MMVLHCKALFIRGGSRGRGGGSKKVGVSMGVVNKNPLQPPPPNAQLLAGQGYTLKDWYTCCRPRFLVLIRKLVRLQWIFQTVKKWRGGGGG